MQSKTQTVGYPRIGKARELKKALESYWDGSTCQSHLMRVSREVLLSSVRDQIDAEIGLISIGSHTLYDQVLDWTVRFGLLPERFGDVRLQNTKRGFPCSFACDWRKLIYI
eukprot:Polyplicarium_translucidae@DN3471_c0_g1_i1.p1